MAPAAVHEDSQQTCGFASWRARGWCRLEEWANFLSFDTLMPLVVTNASKISTYSKLAFMLVKLGKPELAPCSGSFSCCSMNHAVQVGTLRRRVPCDKVDIAHVPRKMFNAKFRSELKVAPAMAFIFGRSGAVHLYWCGGRSRRV